MNPTRRVLYLQALALPVPPPVLELVALRSKLAFLFVTVLEARDLRGHLRDLAVRRGEKRAMRQGILFIMV